MGRSVKASIKSKEERENRTVRIENSGRRNGKITRNIDSGRRNGKIIRNIVVVRIREIALLDDETKRRGARRNKIANKLIVK